MTTNTRDINVETGKKGFQNRQRKQASDTDLGAVSAEVASDTVAADLDVEAAYALRDQARNALLRQGRRQDAKTNPKTYMAVVASAQFYTLLNNNETDASSSWNEGGIDAARAATNGSHLAFANEDQPLTGERRDAIGKEMLDVALGQYSGDVGSPVLYDGYASNRDAYIENACLALDDNGTRYDVANELKRICDEEVAEGRDPRSLDRLSLYVQARTTVAAKNDTGVCSNCGEKTTFDIDYGYPHCSNCS